MTNATLTVPAEHAEDFRTAMLEEIAFDVDWVQGHRKSLDEARAYETDRIDVSQADLLAAARELEHDARLFSQVGGAGEGAFEIRTDNAAALAHMCETLASKVLAPKLARAVNTSPIDSDWAPTIRALIASLSWAVDHAAELHDKAAAERKEEVA